MDGVIFDIRNFWIELHKKLGTWEEGKVLSHKYLENDYARLVEEVAHRLWKGRDATAYHALISSLRYLPGVQEVFAHAHRHGYTTAIISASSMHAARRAQGDLGIDHIIANDLVIEHNRITGEFHWPIGAGNQSKAMALRNLQEKLKIPKKHSIYVGDSDTDAHAFDEVALPIAFNSESKMLKQKAVSLGGYVVDSNNLAGILRYLPTGHLQKNSI